MAAADAAPRSTRGCRKRRPCRARLPLVRGPASRCHVLQTLWERHRLLSSSSLNPSHFFPRPPQPNSAQAQAQAASDAAQASAAAAQTAAYLREQQQQFLDQQRQVAAQRQAWQEQVWGSNGAGSCGASGDGGGTGIGTGTGSAGHRSNNSGSPPPVEAGNSKISVAMFAAQQQQLVVQQQQLADLQVGWLFGRGAAWCRPCESHPLPIMLLHCVHNMPAAHASHCRTPFAPVLQHPPAALSCCRPAG